jgi:hypothetical protein
MRKLTWIWRLPSGVDVKATFDGRGEHASVESVWLGQRLVSRALAGQRPHGHFVALAYGIGDAGPYREAAGDLRVVFDEPFETCTMWLGDRELPPWRSPRSEAARRATQLVALSLCVGTLLLLAVAWAFPRVEPPTTAVRWIDEAEWVSSRLDEIVREPQASDDGPPVVTLSPIVIYGEPPRARKERSETAKESVELQRDESRELRRARPAKPDSCVVEEEACLPNEASWSSSSRSSAGGAPSSD